MCGTLNHYLPENLQFYSSRREIKWDYATKLHWLQETEKHVTFLPITNLPLRVSVKMCSREQIVELCGFWPWKWTFSQFSITWLSVFNKLEKLSSLSLCHRTTPLITNINLKLQPRGDRRPKLQPASMWRWHCDTDHCLDFNSISHNIKYLRPQRTFPARCYQPRLLVENSFWAQTVRASNQRVEITSSQQLPPNPGNLEVSAETGPHMNTTF